MLREWRRIFVGHDSQAPAARPSRLAQVEECDGRVERVRIILLVCGSGRAARVSLHDCNASLFARLLLVAVACRLVFCSLSHFLSLSLFLAQLSAATNRLSVAHLLRCHLLACARAALARELPVTWWTNARAPKGTSW